MPERPGHNCLKSDTDAWWNDKVLHQNKAKRTQYRINYNF